MVKISQLRQISYRLGMRLRKPTKKSQLQQRTTTNAIQSLAAEPVKPQRPLLRQLLLGFAPCVEQTQARSCAFRVTSMGHPSGKKAFQASL